MGELFLMCLSTSFSMILARKVSLIDLHPFARVRSAHHFQYISQSNSTNIDFNLLQLYNPQLKENVLDYIWTN